MTAYAFCEWVNNDLLTSSHLHPQYPRSISVRTAIQWQKHLGFKSRSHKKGFYIDSLEHEDVVKHHKKWKVFEDHAFAIWESHTNHYHPVQMMHLVSEMKVMKTRRPLCLFIMTNQFITVIWMWAVEDHPAILPKTKGSGIMVLDFISEHQGYITLSLEEHERTKRQFPDIPATSRV